MAIWPFNRNKQDDTLPEEVKEFYESEQKQRTGKAWLLALGTLVVTVVLAMVLFFGGRWAFQKIAGDDKKEPATTQPAQNQNENRDSANQTVTDSPKTDNNGDNGDDAVTNLPSDDSDEDTPAPSSATEDEGTTPSTGSTGTEIPDTGPGPNGLQ